MACSIMAEVWESLGASAIVELYLCRHLPVRESSTVDPASRRQQRVEVGLKTLYLRLVAKCLPFALPLCETGFDRRRETGALSNIELSLRQVNPQAGP